MNKHTFLSKRTESVHNSPLNLPSTGIFSNRSPIIDPLPGPEFPEGPNIFIPCGQVAKAVSRTGGGDQPLGSGTGGEIIQPSVQDGTAVIGYTSTNNDGKEVNTSKVVNIDGQYVGNLIAGENLKDEFEDEWETYQSAIGWWNWQNSANYAALIEDGDYTLKCGAVPLAPGFSFLGALKGNGLVFKFPAAVQ